MHRQAERGGNEHRPFILLAVADYAEGKDVDMPDLLNLALDCEQWRALPATGGLYDQPAGLLRKMRQVLNIYRAVKMHEEEGKLPGQMARWRAEHEQAWAIVSEINELREHYG